MTRNRVVAIGELIDEEIRQEITENRTADKPAKQMVVGIGGAFVKGRCPTDLASLEIITARIETETGPGKMLAIVRDRDRQARQQLQALLRRCGRASETRVRVLSDGEEGIRSMVGRWFNAN
ncbi:MAG TPA: hypothetical protein VGX94_01870 [Terriglobia bacterium]|nr:hypothetical protein [Terriglobia bacterium]